jgi:sugar lactone lactonase YvrE
MRVAAAATVAALAAGSFPAVISLPHGWQPEGIAVGAGTTFYVGSIATGGIYRGDLRTGRGAVLVAGASGRAAAGLKAAGGRLYVSGASTGKASVYDSRTGKLLREYRLASGTTFVNDVVVTSRGAYFTDSSRSVLYFVPKSLGAARSIALTGDFKLTVGTFNLNGIAATASERTLLSVDSATGKLFTIDAATGVTKAIDLGDALLLDGDGILLVGRTLYVVQNQDNRIAVVALSRDFSRGKVTRSITSPKFDVPTTIARLGDRLYAVNARFGTAAGRDTTYSVVQVRR